MLEMKNKEDIKDIMQYGKAGGAFLLLCLLPDICDINNFFCNFKLLSKRLSQKGCNFSK